MQYGSKRIKDIKKSNLDTKFGYQPTKSIFTLTQPPNRGSNVQPSIIHCKDCKHYATNDNICTRLFVTLPMNPYDFCSYGKRKGG